MALALATSDGLQGPKPSSLIQCGLLYVVLKASWILMLGNRLPASFYGSQLNHLYHFWPHMGNIEWQSTLHYKTHMHHSNTIRLTYFPFLNLIARTNFKRCMRSWTYILIVLDTGVMHIDSSGAWVRMTSRRHQSAQTAWRAAQPSPSLMLAAAIAAATVDIYQSAALPHHTLPLTRPRKSHYRPT
jgi:hypothetical protein